MPHVFLRRGSFQRKVTWVGSMPRIRALLMARAKDIPRQIGQHGVVTVAVVLAEGDPLPPPDVSRDGRENGLLAAAFKAAKNCAVILRERASTGTRNSAEPAPSAGHQE